MPRKTGARVEYKGWKVSSGWNLPTVPNTISPEEFYEQFVKTRKPGLF